MGTLNDEIKRATGGPTVNDGLRSWFSATASETVQDAERRWLLVFLSTGPDGTNNDLWSQYLTDLTLLGTLSDQKLQYWTAQ